MKILIKGAGDLATGIGSVLFRQNHQVVMTELEKPLAVRRMAAFSEAVYEGRTRVEEIEAVCVADKRQMEKELEKGHIPVLVDETAQIRKIWRPDVIVDAILAKRNTGTCLSDAPFTIGVGPGFCAGEDCHVVIESMRGKSLGEIIYEGSAIPNTGIPGEVGGYTKERLLQAAGDGTMKAAAKIGQLVAKGEIVAWTGGCPVYAQIDGVVRGMLRDGMQVKKGLKIGDVDPRGEKDACSRISDKALKIGEGAGKAVRDWGRRDFGIVLLAAGSSSRFGENKLFLEIDGCRMYEKMLNKLQYFFPENCVVVSGYPQILETAKERGMRTVFNGSPGLGIAHSLTLGLRGCLDWIPQVERVMFCVCDQPNLRIQTMRRLLETAREYPERIICAGNGKFFGNPVVWDRAFFLDLLRLQGDQGGKQLFSEYRKQVIDIQVEEWELKDLDTKEDLMALEAERTPP